MTMVDANSDSKEVGKGNVYAALAMLDDDMEEGEEPKAEERGGKIDEMAVEEYDNWEDAADAAEAAEEDELEGGQFNLVEKKNKAKVDKRGEETEGIGKKGQGKEKPTAMRVTDKTNRQLGSQGFEFNMRAEVNVEKGTAVNPQEIMQWLLMEMWKIDRNTRFSSSAEGADDRTIRVIEDYPLGPQLWREFFQYADKDLKSGGVTLTYAVKVHSRLEMSGFKKVTAFMAKLREKNVFLAAHKYKTLEMQSIGFIVGKNEDTVDRAKFAVDFKEELESALLYIKLDDEFESEESEVPMFEVLKKTVFLDNRDDKDRFVERVDTTALEVKCEKEKAMYLKEIIMASYEMIDSKKFGKFTPYSLQADQDSFVDMISQQNEFIAKRSVIYINGVHKTMMYERVIKEDDTNNKASMYEILTRNDAIKSVDPHFHMEDFGQFTIVTTKDQEENSIKLIDMALAKLRTTVEIEEYKGHNFFYNPRRLSGQTAGNPLYRQKEVIYSSKITLAKVGDKRAGVIKTRPQTKIRGVVVVWNKGVEGLGASRASGQGATAARVSGGQGHDGYGAGKINSGYGKGLDEGPMYGQVNNAWNRMNNDKNKDEHVRGSYRDNVSLTGSTGTLGSETMTVITRHIEATNDTLERITAELKAQREQLSSANSELLRQREENAKLRLEIEQQRLEDKQVQAKSMQQIEEMHYQNESFKERNMTTQIELAKLIGDLTNKVAAKTRVSNEDDNEDDRARGRHTSQGRIAIKKKRVSIEDTRIRDDDEDTDRSGSLPIKGASKAKENITVRELRSTNESSNPNKN